jgi:hypothetical protein
VSGGHRRHLVKEEERWLGDLADPDLQPAPHILCARRIGPVQSRSHTLTVPPRSREQRLLALARANEVRLARAQLKRELAAGAIELAQVLSAPPASAQTAKLRELLLAVPRIGPARVHRALAHCRIAETKTVVGLSDRQRAELIEFLRN